MARTIRIDDTPILSPVCTFCRNLVSTTNRTCRAFPKGIPLVIWNGDNKHSRPFAGDNNIQFVSISKPDEVEVP